jgi:hypothetical protein
MRLVAVSFEPYIVLLPNFVLKAENFYILTPEHKDTARRHERQRQQRSHLDPRGKLAYAVDRQFQRIPTGYRRFPCHTRRRLNSFHGPGLGSVLSILPPSPDTGTSSLASNIKTIRPTIGSSDCNGSPFGKHQGAPSPCGLCSAVSLSIAR